MDDLYRVIILDRAFADIQKALSFLARVSKEAADDLNSQLKEVILSLRQFPFRFDEVKMPKELGFSFRRTVINGHYLLIYSIKDDLVVVERLLDARQGFAALV